MTDVTLTKDEAGMLWTLTGHLKRPVTELITPTPENLERWASVKRKMKLAGVL